MRSDATFPQKTNITSLATTAGTLTFVIWIASIATPRDSIYAQGHAPPSISANLSANHKGAEVGRFADQGSTRGRG